MSTDLAAKENQSFKIGGDKASKSASKIPKLKATPAAEDRPRSSPKLHALGKVPEYILRLRPKYTSNGGPSKKKTECPPSEGINVKETNLKDDSKLDLEEVIETTNLEEKELSEKSISKTKQEVIDELNQYLQAARITPSDETELTIAKLRRELAQRSAILVENRKLMCKIEALEQQLLHEAQRLSEKDQRILKLQQESLGFRDQIRELRKTVAKLQQDLAAKERLLAEKDIKISKLQATKENEQDLQKLEQFQTDVSKLQSEVIIPLDVNKPDDALDEVRRRVLNVIKACKETFKERCEEFSRLEGAGDNEQKRFDAIFETLAKKQRQCCQEEDEIRSLNRKNQRCRAQRTEMLRVLKKLIDENKQLRSATARDSKESKVFNILKESTSTEGNGEVFEDAASDFENHEVKPNLV